MAARRRKYQDVPYDPKTQTVTVPIGQWLELLRNQRRWVIGARWGWWR